jgi:two-component system nitrate/nitrite response regulator NarL
MDIESPRILILEDQALVRAGMRELILICEPHSRVDESSRYEEAITELIANKYDIVFLDIDLRGQKSGLDVLRYIQENEIETRAVMLSGRAERDVVLACIDGGASGYIQKDMDSEGLFRKALDTVFQGSVFLPSSALGRGGFTPPSLIAPAGIPATSIGVSGRLLETLYYLCQGLPNKTIARKMGISEETVRKDYNTRLFQHFKVSRRTELIVEMSRRGITVPKPETSTSESVRQSL